MAEVDANGAGGESRRAPRIAVVDDDPAVRRLLTFLCERRLGAEVSTAADADEAIALLGQGKPDLVLLDYSMPGMDGLGLLRRLREDEALRDLAVVAVSGSGSRDTVVDMVDLGVLDYILKPVSPDTAQRRLTRVLRELGFELPPG